MWFRHSLSDPSYSPVATDNGESTEQSEVPTRSSTRWPVIAMIITLLIGAGVLGLTDHQSEIFSMDVMNRTRDHIKDPNESIKDSYTPTHPPTTTSTKVEDGDDNHDQHEDDSTYVLPNVLLAGVQKGGTSAVAEWLFRKHGICRPQTLDGESIKYNKEVHFFDETERLSQGLPFYSQRFESCRDQMLGRAVDMKVGEGNSNMNNTTLPRLAMDATPENQRRPKEIRSFYQDLSTSSTIGGDKDDLKVIMILREPTSRVLSIYNHMTNIFAKNPDTTQWYAEPILKTFDDDNMETNTNETLIYNFDEYVTHSHIEKLKRLHKKAKGYYVDHLKDWLEWMPRDRILLLAYSELVEDPQSFMRRIELFLNLKHIPHEAPPSKVNAKYSPNKVKMMSCSSQQELLQYFYSKNEELYDFLDKHPGPSMEQRPFPRFELSPCEE